MVRNKKIAGILLVLAMLLGLLSGCGAKAPTAQELMDGAAAAGSDGYADMAMELTASGETEGQKVELSFTGGVEGSGDIAHVYDAAMSIGMSGLSMEFGMEAWLDQASGTGYVNMSMMGEESGWTKSGIEDSAASLGEMAGTSWLTDGADEYVLQDHKKGEDWVVAFKVSADKLSDAMEGVSGDSLDGDLDVEARFDEKTHELKSVTAACDTDGMRVSITITVKSRGDKSLAIPSEIIESAVDGASGDDWGGYDDDGDYGGWESAGGAYIDDDGDGEDELLAQAAQGILATGTADGAISIWHYSYENELSWNTYDPDSDWMIAASITHITDDTFGGAREEYESTVSFTASFFGDDGALYKGGQDEEYAAYVRHTSYSHELDYVKLYAGQDCVLSVDVYCYTDGASDADLWDLLQSFLDVHGLD